MPEKNPEPIVPSVEKTVEQWAEEKRIPRWVFSATRARAKWAIGQIVSEKTFDDAVTAARTTRAG